MTGKENPLENIAFIGFLCSFERDLILDMNSDTGRNPLAEFISEAVVEMEMSRYVHLPMPALQSCPLVGRSVGSFSR